MIKENAQLTARKAAFLGLYDIFEKDAYANLTLLSLLRGEEWSAEDRRFLTALLYGVCRRWNLLLWLMEKCASRPAAKMNPEVRLLLALGLYQLRFMDAVPDRAAVHETVELAKDVTHEGNVRFVNAVLRGYLRKKETISIPDDFITHTALTENFPAWLIRRWEKAWGREKAAAVFHAFNETAPTDIRCNTLKLSADELERKLEAAGAEPRRISFLSDGFSLGNPTAFFRADFLAKGLAYVQNRASMLPPLVLAPRPGERVLDMCAAPGSKTTQLAALMENEGHIDAWDIHPHKIRIIEENCRRLGISIVSAAARDASAPLSEAREIYDRVLLDAPCSGLGVLGRKTELRWRRREKEIASFPLLQRTLLSRAAEYVRPGGLLVYSTCTLEPSENEGNAAFFLQNHPDFMPEPIRLPGLSSETGTVTLWPEEGGDGFFVAAFRKISN